MRKTAGLFCPILALLIGCHVLRVDGSPAVKESIGHGVEGEIVTPICTWLIPVSADWYARKMAQKQRSCASMSEHRNVAVTITGTIQRCAGSRKSRPVLRCKRRNRCRG